jgi:hypothetical protein
VLESVDVEDGFPEEANTFQSPRVRAIAMAESKTSISCQLFEAGLFCMFCYRTKPFWDADER